MSTIIKIGIAGFLVVLVLIIYVYAVQKKETAATATAVQSAVADTAPVQVPDLPPIPESTATSEDDSTALVPPLENAVEADPTLENASAAVPAPVPAEPSEPKEYIVQKSDTLSSIAEKFYGNRALYMRIYEANRNVIGSSPNVIKEGTKLLIPPLETAPASPSAGTREPLESPDADYDVYTVVQGDNLRAISKKLYGDEPIFIFDPSNDTNRPDPAVHKNAVIYWNIYPQLLKDLFIKSFTQGLTNPENGRVRESEWRSALLKVRDMIVYCQKCNSENFCDLNQSINGSSKPLFCWSCRKEILLPPKMKIGSTFLVLNYNSRIYPHHLDSFSDVLDKPIAEITQNPKKPSLWGLKNLSDKNWLATKNDKSSLEILPGKSVALANNLKINFGKAEGEVQI